ncbi:MAG: SpoIIE family protein phosphatase [Bacteroidales bacterium]|nr:SpoIIE family protein phosphatase [Bacteroidales bacterium]
MNLYNKHIIIFIFLLFPLLSFSQIVENGILDLHDAEFNKAYLVAGSWEFYWNELLTPDDLRNRQPKEDNFIRVNGDWNSYLYNNKPVKHYGYGTYKMKILAPKGAYTIQFHQVLTSYKVWIDGDFKIEVGTVGTSRQNSTPKPLINEINFFSNSDTIEIVIQVSNFYHGAGGLQEKIFFGKTNDVQAHTTKHLLISFFIIGAETIFALYFFFLFFFRQKDLSYIFLSLAIIIFIAFELVNGEMILIRYFPSISWELVKKIDFFSNYGRLFFFSLFIWSSYKEYKIFNKYIIYTIIGLSAIYSLIVLFTPSYIFSKTLISFMIWGEPAFLALLVFSINGLIKKVPYIIFSFFGLLALNVSAINDMLYNTNVINTGYFGSYGLLLLFIGSSIMISLKYSKTSTRVNKLANKYQKYAQIQSELVKLQSFDLQASMKVFDEFLQADKIEFLIKKEIWICECIKTKEEYICGNLEKNFPSSITEEDIENASKNLSIINKRDSLIIPVSQSNKIKALLHVSYTEKQNLREKADIMEMLVPQISTIVDNYTFYWNLEILNKNLENIIEVRTQEVYKQKNELESKNIELDEKIEELNISSSIVEDLNDELKSQRQEINIKNKQLNVLRKQTAIQKNILEEKQSNIHSSISYSLKIQNALLSSIQNFPFEDMFILNIPKEIVSGDFYISIVIDDIWLWGLIDTTGRNVSATFLSFLIESIISETLDKNPDIIKQPAELIEDIRLKYHNNIGEQKIKEIDDSFDISLCSINLNTGRMKFSGANQHFIVIRKDEPIVLKGDNLSIGGYYTSFDDKFSTTEFDLKAEDNIYLSSDGYHKQMGYKNKSKFGSANFISLLTQSSHLNPEKQKEILLEKHLAWRGKIKQVDDILVIGVKFSK